MLTLIGIVRILLPSSYFENLYSVHIILKGNNTLNVFLHMYFFSSALSPNQRIFIQWGPETWRLMMQKIETVLL